MSVRILDVIEYLLKRSILCTDNKYLIINLIENVANVKIDVIGSWIKEFSIEKFHNEIWTKHKTPDTTLHLYRGDHPNNKHEIHKLTDDNIQLVMNSNKPFIKDCNYYLSFVYTDSTQNLIQIVKNYLEQITPLYAGVKITFTHWKDTNQNVRIICDALSDVLQYSTSLEFCDRIFNLYQCTNRQTVIEKSFNILS